MFDRLSNRQCLNHVARLHFSCVYSLVFPKVNNFSFGNLDIHHWMYPSVYDLSSSHWLIINWWTTHRHQRIDYTLYHSCTPIVLLAHHMAYTRQVKDGSLLNIRCPACCSYSPMSQKTFLIEDGNIRLYILKDTYNHIVSENLTNLTTALPEYKYPFIQTFYWWAWM